MQGPTYVFNPCGLGGLESTVTFDPLLGCEDFATAKRRATDIVGHSGTTVTELIYRDQIRPVIQTGALVMDGRFKPTGT